jgi:hypothetical protein
MSAAGPSALPESAGEADRGGTAQSGRPRPGKESHEDRDQRVRTNPTAGTLGGVRVTGRRVVAVAVDGFVIAGIYAAVAATFGTDTTDGGASHRVAAMPAAATVAYAVVVALYLLLREGYRRRSPGRIAVGVTVVTDAAAAPPGPAAAAVRTASRLIRRPRQLPHGMHRGADHRQTAAGGRQGRAHRRRAHLTARDACRSRPGRSRGASSC